MASLCHPWFTTTNLSYRFPIFETSATALCGTTGNYGLSMEPSRTFCPNRKIYVAAGEVSTTLQKQIKTVTFRYAFTKSRKRMQNLGGWLKCKLRCPMSIVTCWTPPYSIGAKQIVTYNILPPLPGVGIILLCAAPPFRTKWGPGAKNGCKIARLKLQMQP